MKYRREIAEILKRNIDDHQKIEEISKLKTCVTDIGKLILMTEEEISSLQINQKITNLGNKWKDLNDINASNEDDVPDDIHQCYRTYFSCDNVSGYKIEYFNENYFVELFDCDYEKVDKKLDEIKHDKTYQNFMHLIGSDLDMQNECEILISNDTVFMITDIIEDEDQDCYFIKLLQIY